MDAPESPIPDLPWAWTLGSHAPCGCTPREAGKEAFARGQSSRASETVLEQPSRHSLTFDYFLASCQGKARVSSPVPHATHTCRD